jgi:hypothetical protein
MLEKQEIEELNTKFLNKRILVTDSTGKTIGGKCTFIGFNNLFPSWGLQVTVDRMPISNVNPKNIKLNSYE